MGGGGGGALHSHPRGLCVCVCVGGGGGIPTHSAPAGSSICAHSLGTNLSMSTLYSGCGEPAGKMIIRLLFEPPFFF